MPVVPRKKGGEEMILEKYGPKNGYEGYSFYCPGCKHLHVFYTMHPKGIKWSFNGDMDNPTFSPSLKNTVDGPVVHKVCHLFVRNGMIEFCGDCTHDHAGKSVPLTEEPPL